MEYYIKETEQADGPYDMMAIIRKIRNGSVTEGTMLAPSLFEDPKPAGDFHELSDFFSEGDEDLQSINSMAPRRSSSFKMLLRAGSDFLRQNQFAAVYSGLFMICWLVLAMLFMFNGSVVMSLVGIALSYFIMGGYLYGILRYVRGNPVTAGLIVSRMGNSAVNMGVVSCVVAVVMLPGVLLTVMMGSEMLFISMPILFIFLLCLLTVLAFTPLLITDKGYDFWDAMMSSLRVVTANKGQQLGNVFALVAMNFILLPLMPVILPMSMGALMEIYDEHFG